MTVALHSLVPLIGIIVAGCIFGRLNGEATMIRKALIAYCFYFGMPALLVRTVATAKPTSSEPQLIWLAYLTPIAICWVLAVIYAVRWKRITLRGAAPLAMAATYGNVLMLGIPLALSQLGPEATGTIALVVLAHSPILFGVAALQSEFRAPSRSDNETPSMAPIGLAFIPMAAPIRFARVMVEVIDDLAKNPIILAILIGGALRVGDVHLPDTFDKLLGMLGQATLPCVLVAIGIALATFEIKGQRDTLMVLVALKLAVLPVLAWLLATHYFKLAPIDVNVITLFCAMPAGANAYVFATRVASGEATVSSAVALSTILSVFSIVCALMSMQT